MRNLLHAEWTKFRTVRGWVLGVALGAALIIGFGLLPGAQGSCGTRGPECVVPRGPEGQEITDAFMFVHQPLTGDGSITARIASMTGVIPPLPGSEQARDQINPWAKAGLILKDGTKQGSAYVAVMLTGGHGVRMQYNYVHDKAGQQASSDSPIWLRLSRTKEKIVAEASAEGTAWTTVGSVNLAGLPTTVQAGLFVTSPQWTESVTESFGANGAASGPSKATAGFDNITLGGAWTATRIGGPPNMPDEALGGANATGENSWRVTGSGDIAPAIAGAAGLGATISETLLGTFAGLIVVVVISAMFVTAEYRRGLIRITLAASPSRGRVLAAKAIVVGTVAFLLGIVAAGIVVTFGQDVLRDNGVYVHPATTATELRVIAGTGALLGTAAIMSVGLGALLRRGTAAVTTAIVTIVLPYLLAMTVLPAGAAQWLLRIAPAAAFSLQQSSIEYPQVVGLYIPANGYFPLPAWAGFAVLAGWAFLALALAAQRLRRQDA